MLRIDRIFREPSFFGIGCMITAVADERGLYLIDTGPYVDMKSAPHVGTAGQVAKVAAGAVIGRMRTKALSSWTARETEIDQTGYAQVPLGKRGVFIARDEIDSVERKQPATLVLKTRKGKFKLTLEAGLHPDASARAAALVDVLAPRA